MEFVGGSGLEPRSHALSRSWSNRNELALAKDFVNRLDSLPVGESGRLLLEVVGSDEATQATAAELSKAVQGKYMWIWWPSIGPAFGAS